MDLGFSGHRAEAAGRLGPGVLPVVVTNSVQPGLHTTERLAAIYGDDLPAHAAGGAYAGLL